MIGFVVEFFADLVVERAGNAVRGRRAVWRFRRTGAVDCAVRLVSGRFGRFDRSWVYGQVIVPGGRAVFVEDATAVEIRLRVLEIDVGRLRRSPLREDHVVVRLVTATGVLEWDLIEAVLDHARAALTVRA